MNLMISEVQITCVILMGLITLFLAFVIERYTVVGKMYGYARKILSLGTMFVSIHFMVQYGLHKSAPDNEALLRTLVNLSFGIPMSYFFNLSNYYLLRKGKVSWVNWVLAPAAFVLAMITLAVCILTEQLLLAAILMAVMYAFTLIYYGVIQIVEYFRVVQKIRSKVDFSLLPYIKWTRWSLFVMVIIAFGFPLMTFNENLLVRSFYGIFSISSCFFYVLSFMGYGINGAVSANYSAKHTKQAPVAPAVKYPTVDDEIKMEHLREVVNAFIQKGSYLRNGITQKEAAEEMGIAPYRLKTWLNSTEFETFSRWVVYLRLMKAKEMLLLDPDMGGDELAEKCGFCDRQYFQRSFRKWTGMTPSQWVRQDGNKEVPTLNMDEIIKSKKSL